VTALEATLCSTSMPRHRDINSLEDVKVWIAEHDGRIDAWWDAQHQWNTSHHESHGAIHSRLASIERRIIYVSGIFAGAGGLLGSLVPWFLK
jgi:hypothetical protein